VVVNSKYNENPINRRSAFIGIRNGGGISICNRRQILVFKGSAVAVSVSR